MHSAGCHVVLVSMHELHAYYCNAVMMALCCLTGFFGYQGFPALMKMVIVLSCDAVAVADLLLPLLVEHVLPPALEQVVLRYSGSDSKQAEWVQQVKAAVRQLSSSHNTSDVDALSVVSINRKLLLGSVDKADEEIGQDDEHSVCIRFGDL